MKIVPISGSGASDSTVAGLVVVVEPALSWQQQTPHRRGYERMVGAVCQHGGQPVQSAAIGQPGSCLVDVCVDLHLVPLVLNRRA